MTRAHPQAFAILRAASANPLHLRTVRASSRKPPSRVYEVATRNAPLLRQKALARVLRGRRFVLPGMPAAEPEVRTSQAEVDASARESAAGACPKSIGSTAGRKVRQCGDSGHHHGPARLQSR